MGPQDGDRTSDRPADGKIELRARNASQAWDLRCAVTEKLAFLQTGSQPPSPGGNADWAGTPNKVIGRTRLSKKSLTGRSAI